jgi:hypothetical protein
MEVEVINPEEMKPISMMGNFNHAVLKKKTHFNEWRTPKSEKMKVSHSN